MKGFIRRPFGYSWNVWLKAVLIIFIVVVAVLVINMIPKLFL